MRFPYIVVYRHADGTDHFEECETLEQADWTRANLEQAQANPAVYGLMDHSPDLLEACKAIVRWDPAAGPNEQNGMSIMDAQDICRAAIAKAEGRDNG